VKWYATPLYLYMSCLKTRPVQKLPVRVLFTLLVQNLYKCERLQGNSRFLQPVLNSPLILAALNFGVFARWTRPASYTVLLIEYSWPVIVTNLLRSQNSQNKGHTEISGFTESYCRYLF